jgi:hypothetical protein
LKALQQERRSSKWSIDPRPLYFKIEPEKKALDQAKRIE